MRLRFARPVRPLPLRDQSLALDDVVDLKHLRLARLDPNLFQDRHEALTERLELRWRVPDLADSELTVRLEGTVEFKSLRRPGAHLLQPADGFVVLVRGHTGRGREADEHARLLAGVH